MKKPYRTASISLLLVLTILLLTATVAFAAQPLGFQMIVDEFITGGGETFFASGPAVAAGDICSTGITNDTYSNVYGPTNGNYTYIYIVKSYACTDLSGTFYIKMKVKLNNNTGYTTAKWHFTDGSGAYSRLRGHGTLVGTPTGPGTIQDVYTGTVH